MSSNSQYRIPWQSNDPLALPLKILEASLSQFGFALISSPDTDTDRLIKLSEILGVIQRHERSSQNGVVDVTNQPNPSFDPKHYKGLSNAEFPPHTDGAYLDLKYRNISNKVCHIGPPSLLILQCIIPADHGGESLLVDGQKLFHDLKQDDDLLRLLMSNSVIFYRKHLSSDITSVFKPLDANNRIMFRFRIEARAPHHVSHALKVFFSQYIQNQKYHIKLTLKSGDLLIVDNLRMLHARRAFTMNTPNGYRHLRRTWVHHPIYAHTSPVEALPPKYLLSESDKEVLDYNQIPKTRNNLCNLTLGIQP